jgi:methylated-DNA-[protein]-cysteine S-methyltransferase
LNPEASSLALTAELTIPTPLGEMLLARSQQGLAGAWFTDQVACPKPSIARQALNDSLLREAEHQLAGYFTGQTNTFDLPLDTSLWGTAFQQQVWQALRQLAPGQTCSYQTLASAVGRPLAARATGSAVGRNPMLIIVPCHRVIGARGQLTGYAAGLARKQALLNLEQKHGGAQKMLSEPLVHAPFNRGAP